MIFAVHHVTHQEMSLFVNYFGWEEEDCQLLWQLVKWLSLICHIPHHADLLQALCRCVPGGNLSELHKSPLVVCHRSPKLNSPRRLHFNSNNYSAVSIHSGSKHIVWYVSPYTPVLKHHTNMVHVQLFKSSITGKTNKIKPWHISKHLTLSTWSNTKNAKSMLGSRECGPYTNEWSPVGWMSNINDWKNQKLNIIHQPACCGVLFCKLQ